SSKSKLNRSEKLSFSVQLAQVGFCAFLDADLVERIESSVISKSLKTINPRCFNVVGCSTRKVWFHKGYIIAEIVLSLSEMR
ncbi:hypothetical protein, partial [Vibrio cholerae]|uniref:hypothetical protein n=1 Tax=Vibrio cholerae TaxID=666 RepID=UPI001CA334E7